MAELLVAEVAADALLGCTFEWAPRGLVITALDRSANPHLPVALQLGAVLQRFNGENVSAADTTFEDIVSRIRSCSGVRRFEFSNDVHNAATNEPAVDSSVEIKSGEVMSQSQPLSAGRSETNEEGFEVKEGEENLDEEEDLDDEYGDSEPSSPSSSSSSSSSSSTVATADASGFQGFAARALSGWSYRVSGNDSKSLRARKREQERRLAQSRERVSARLAFQQAARDAAAAQESAKLKCRGSSRNPSPSPPRTPSSRPNSRPGSPAVASSSSDSPSQRRPGSPVRNFLEEMQTPARPLPPYPTTASVPPPVPLPIAPLPWPHASLGLQGALHVEVEDLSAWYAGRSMHGASAHAYRKVWRVDKGAPPSARTAAKIKQTTAAGIAAGGGALMNARPATSTAPAVPQEWAAELVRMTFRAQDNEYMALPERVANLGGAQQQQLQNRTPSTSASSSMSLGLQNKPKMTFRTEDAAYRALEKAADERDLAALVATRKENYETRLHAATHALQHKHKEELRTEKARRKAMQSTRSMNINTGSEREDGLAATAASSFDGATVGAVVKEKEEPSEELPLFEETHVKLLVVSAAFHGLSHSERVHLVVGCLEHQLAYEAKLKALEQPWADPRWPDEQYSDDDDEECSDSSDTDEDGEDEENEEGVEKEQISFFKGGEEFAAREELSASQGMHLIANSNAMTPPVLSEANSALRKDTKRKKKKKCEAKRSLCRAPLLPVGAGAKLKHVGIVGAHVRAWPGWSGGASMSHAAEGWHHSHFLNKRSNGSSSRGSRRELWSTRSSEAFRLNSGKGREDDAYRNAKDTSEVKAARKAGRGGGDGVSSNGRDNDSEYPSYRRLKRRRCPQPLPALLLDLRTPNQWKPDLYPPDAYERADALLHRNRLLRGPSPQDPNDNSDDNSSPNHRLLSPGKSERLGKSRQSPSRGSPSTSQSGLRSPLSPWSPSSRALIVPETKDMHKMTKKKNLNMKGGSGLPGDVEAATAGAQVADRAWQGAVASTKAELLASDRALKIEVHARHDEEARRLLGKGNKPLAAVEAATAVTLEDQGGRDGGSTSNNGTGTHTGNGTGNSKNTGNSNDSKSRSSGGGRWATASALVPYLKYGATLDNPPSQACLYLYEELKAAEEREALDDLKDPDPLPPPPRKKYLAHHLYGLASDHKALMVQQLNGQLHRHDLNRKHMALPVQGSLRDPVEKVVVPPGDNPAWGPGGPAVTATAVLGRLQASLLEVSRWALRCQRLWRLQQVPKCLAQRAKRSFAAIALQRCFRGWVARSFVALYRPLKDLAAALIQKMYRSKRDRRLVLAYRRLIRAAATKVQATFRAWVGRAYFAYLLNHWKAAIIIERAVRSFIARCTAKILALATAARRFYNVSLPAKPQPKKKKMSKNLDLAGAAVSSALSLVSSNGNNSLDGRSLGSMDSGSQSSTNSCCSVGSTSNAGIASVVSAAVGAKKIKKLNGSRLPNVFGPGGLYGPARPSKTTMARLKVATEMGGRDSDPCRIDGPKGFAILQACVRGRKQRWWVSGLAKVPPVGGAAFLASGALRPANKWNNRNTALPEGDSPTSPTGVNPITGLPNAKMAPWSGGYRGRIELEVAMRVLAPARLLLQRIVRGHIGRKDLARRRRERDAATVMNRFARGKSARLWRQKVKTAMRLFRLQVRMQRIGRGFVTRKWFEIQYRHAFLERVEIPAAIKLEALARMRAQVVLMAGRKQGWWAATMLAARWRMWLGHKRVMLEWSRRWHGLREEAATRIQAFYRRKRAAEQYLRLKLEEAGKRIYAARVIMRAWLRVRDRKRFQALKEAWELAQSNDVMADVQEEGLELVEDIEDIVEDVHVEEVIIKRCKVRDKELREFDEQAALRVEVLENDLEEMVEDEDEGAGGGAALLMGGWGEAMVGEKTALENRRHMAAEERRNRRVLMKRAEDAITHLYLEREDLECDLDENGVALNNENELVRRIQLERSDARAAAVWARVVRLERCKWAIDDVRRKVLSRHAESNLNQAKAKAKEVRSFEALATLEAHKVKDMDLEEAHEAEQALRAARREQAKAVVRNGYGNTTLRNSYDAVVATMHAQLKAQTVDLRDVSEVPDPSTGHTSQNQGGGGVGQHDSAAAAEGDALLAASDSGVSFTPVLAKRDARTNKVMMRQLHGYAPTDEIPEEDEEDDDDDGIVDLNNLDEFG